MSNFISWLKDHRDAILATIVMMSKGGLLGSFFLELVRSI